MEQANYTIQTLKDTKTTVRAAQVDENAARLGFLLGFISWLNHTQTRLRSGT